MKKSLLIIFLIALISGFSQDQIIPKNTITLESGIFSRGLKGVGYTRNFKLRSTTFSLGTSIGSGIGATEKKNIYLSLSPEFSFGKDLIYFTVGTDFKYMQFSYLKQTGKSEISGVQADGFGLAPYLGLSFFTDSGVTFKGRAGVIIVNELITYLPSFGFSMGYSF